jgi:hypothetical protein
VVPTAGLEAMEKRKILPLPGIDIPAVQSVARRYTKRAVPIPIGSIQFAFISYFSSAANYTTHFSKGKVVPVLN